MTTKQNQSSQVALWNPMWIILLSFVFTPAFGGIISALNWRAMGKHVESTNSLGWMRTTLFLMVLYIFIEPLLRGIPYTQYVLLTLMVALWLSWTYFDGYKQLKYVNEKFGEGYEHKFWAKCITWGVGGWVAYYAVAITYVLGLHILGITL